MKKALALVLALVLALSMAVSATAAVLENGLVELAPATPAADDKDTVYVLDAEYIDTFVYYANVVGDYYIALDVDTVYTDVKVTANGNVSAELVEYDPAKMDVVFVDIDENGYFNSLADQTIVSAAEKITFKVTCKGEDTAFTGMTYEDACKKVEELEKAEKVTYYDVKCEKCVNIIKVTVENNYSAHYTEGTIKIEAKNAAKKAVSTELTVINDVIIFEYEEVKWAAANKGELQLFGMGYSDYITDKLGYGLSYDEDALRQIPGAAVISTTAFRAIEGKNITVNVLDSDLVNMALAYAELDLAMPKDRAFDVSVTLKEVKAGQKGVNFCVWGGLELKENDLGIESVEFGFVGGQTILGKYAVNVKLPINYYELRELFGLKVEEEDIITYYVVDENGAVVKEIKVDYMTADLSALVAFTVEGENEALGYYTLCLEVPAVEGEVEENPNTGAESVVGVVAALAVVSVATAAAVSLKK